MKHRLGIFFGAILLSSALFAQFVRVDISFAPEIDGPVKFVTLQPDGKIVIAGAFTTVNSTKRPLLARLNHDGTLDGSFMPEFADPQHLYVWQLDLRDGDIYIQIYGEWLPVANEPRVLASPWVHRHSSEGILKQRYPGGSLYLVDSEHRLVWGGTASLCRYGGPGVGRYTEVGTRDTNFSGASLDCLGPIGGWASGVYAMALQQVDHQEKVLIGGYFTRVNTNAAFGLARLNNDGSTDVTFHCTNNQIVTAISLTPDGKILAGSKYGILRGWLPDGTLDPSVTFQTVNDTFEKIIPQQDGGVLALLGHCGGNCYSYPVRFRADGALDTNFLVKPRSNYPVLPVQEAGIRDMVLQADGGILIVGQFTNVNCIRRTFFARLIPSDAPDALPCPPRPQPTLTATRVRPGIMRLCLPTGYGDYTIQAARHLNRRQPEQTKWVTVQDLSGNSWWNCDSTNCCIDVKIFRYGRNYRVVKL